MCVDPIHSAFAWADRLVYRIAAKALGSRFSRLAAFALAGFVGLCDLSPAAHASCGDYLRVGNQPDAGFAPRSTRQHDADELPAPPVRKQPCSGPNCSSSPGENPLVPPPVVQGENQWALVILADISAALPDNVQLDSEVSHRPFHHTYPPDPPPRRACAQVD